jgi:hypothetical protein
MIESWEPGRVVAQGRFARWGRFVARNAATVIALVGALAIGLASQLPRLEVDGSDEAFLPEGDAVRIDFAPLLDELHDHLQEENVAMMADVIRAGVDDGTLRGVDPEKAALVLFVAGRALFRQPHVSYEDTLAVFFELTVYGLLPR